MCIRDRSKGALANAIALYLAASDFIRNVRAPGAQALFNLSPDETNTEAIFRSELTNVLASLNQPVLFKPNSPATIYAEMCIRDRSHSAGGVAADLHQQQRRRVAVHGHQHGALSDRCV